MFKDKALEWHMEEIQRTFVDAVEEPDLPWDATWKIEKITGESLAEFAKFLLYFDDRKPRPNMLRIQPDPAVWGSQLDILWLIPGTRLITNVDDNTVVVECPVSLEDARKELPSLNIQLHEGAI